MRAWSEWVNRRGDRLNHAARENEHPKVEEIAARVDRGLFGEPFLDFGGGDDSLLDGFGQGARHRHRLELIGGRHRESFEFDFLETGFSRQGGQVACRVGIRSLDGRRSGSWRLRGARR